jgi:hypothetical protein
MSIDAQKHVLSVKIMIRKWNVQQVMSYIRTIDFKKVARKIYIGFHIASLFSFDYIVSMNICRVDYSQHGVALEYLWKTNVNQNIERN